MLGAVVGLLGALGAGFLGALAEIGRIGRFVFSALTHALTPRWYVGQIWRQLGQIGYLSLPVVGLTAIFTGAALALNIYVGGSRLNAEAFVPNIVALGITRELGPVFAALMVAGRVSAAIAAEIGTMRVTEQIDALRTLSANPMRYLVAPRVIAATIAMPLLVGVADIIGIMGGWAVGIASLDLNGDIYLKNTMDALENWDVITGLIKAVVFGFLLSSLGCYYGYHSSGGALGVGRATTLAVVSSAVMIFASNYVLTTLFVRLDI